MRTINKYLSVLALAALAGFVSCQVEEVFKPGEEENEKCEGVYFPKQKKIEEVQIFDPTQEKVDTIVVRRANEEGDSLTVTPVIGLSYTDAKGNTVTADSVIFEVSDIVFEPGQVESYIALDFEGVEEGVAYSLHISIDGDAYASKYSSALKACDYKVMCVKYVDFVSPADSTKPAKITFTQDWWGEVHTAYVKYYEVAGVRHCTTYGEALDTAACLAAGKVPGTNWGYKGFWGTGEDYHFEFLWFVEDVAECSEGDGAHACTAPDDSGLPAKSQFLSPAINYIGYNASSGPAAFYDYYQYAVTFGGYARPYLHWVNANMAWDMTSYYDGNGGFYFYSEYYLSDVGGGWYGTQGIDVVGIAEGFTRADYSLKLDAGLTQTDSKGDNVVPISFELGADVAKVGYTILKGAASSAAISNEVNAIAKDTIDYKYATYVDADGVDFSDSVSVAETGVYTLVAVAFDTAKVVKSSASVTFKYLLTGEANEVILNVEAAGTEKYASRGYSPITSIEYSISGSGLTGVIPLIYSEAEVDAEGGIGAVVADLLSDPNYFYDVLKDEDLSDYYLSAQQLADANDKGYVQIATGLKALTTYYVIVWATNGYDVAVKYATHQTDGLPNEIIKDGTGTYTYTLFFTDYDEETDTESPADDTGLNLEFNPNSGLYEIPHWGYNVTFSFEVQEDSLLVPLQPTGYTHSSYGPVYVTDFSHLDEFVGAGFCAYFGIDPNQKGYIDEDGVYHFIVAYAVSAGTFGRGEELFYPDGKPATPPTLRAMKNGSLSLEGVALEKNDNHFIVNSKLEGLKATHGRVEAEHNIGTTSGEHRDRNSLETSRPVSKKNFR